jgi:hypothetical protein
VPSTAFAHGCGNGTSAVQVYTECLKTGGGSKSTSSRTSSQSVPISKQTAIVLKKAGKDATPLENLVKGYGARRLLQSQSSTSATEPTAVGSAFDLGSGPTALLIVLAGTAVVLLAAAGTRTWRRSNRA